MFWQKFVLVFMLLSLVLMLEAQRAYRWRNPPVSNEEVETAGDITQTPRYYGNRMRAQNRQPENDYQSYKEKLNEVPGQVRQVHYKHRNLLEHKCKIWVPTDAADKYEGATKIEIDQSRQLQYIEVCCPGYRTMMSRGKYTCRPVCQNCVNGFCRAPDECICYDQFVHNDNGECVFACPLGCQNGRCYLDGSCQCDAGYKLDETRKFCRPICSSGCGQNPRHNCTEPEVCGCAKGYKLTDEGCQPICLPDCGLGGTCVEYNKCECAVGFTLKDGICQADCYQKCDNGMCYSRNRCICNPEFIYHEHSTQCIPK